MVVSVTLVAMMAVGLWGAFRIGLASWDRGTRSIDENQRSRTVLDLVRKQMASTYGLIAPPDPQSPGPVYPIFEGTEKSLSFISLNSLRFQESPGLTQVTYEVTPDNTGNYSLIARERRYLGNIDDPGSLLDREDISVTPVFENLSSFVFEYFDPGDNINPARWVGEWSGMTTRRLPAAISMTMVVNNSGKDPLSRQMVVSVQAEPADSRLNVVNPFNRMPSTIMGR
jgi:hypothetical protein